LSDFAPITMTRQENTMFKDQIVELLPARTVMTTMGGGGGGGGGGRNRNTFTLVVANQQNFNRQSNSISVG
jgi:hypothetical protein